MTYLSRDSSVRFNLRENLFLRRWEAGPLRTSDDSPQHTSRAPGAAGPDTTPSTAAPGPLPGGPQPGGPQLGGAQLGGAQSRGAQLGGAQPGSAQPRDAQPGRGPAVPTRSATAAQHPLPAPGARLTGGLLHGWQRRNAAASMPLALHQLVVAGNLDNLELAIRAADAPAAAVSRAGTAGSRANGVIPEIGRASCRERVFNWV